MWGGYGRDVEHDPPTRGRLDRHLASGADPNRRDRRPRRRARDRDECGHRVRSSCAEARPVLHGWLLAASRWTCPSLRGPDTSSQRASPLAGHSFADTRSLIALSPTRLPRGGSRRRLQVASPPQVPRGPCCRAPRAVAAQPAGRPRTRGGPELRRVGAVPLHQSTSDTAGSAPSAETLRAGTLDAAIPGADVLAESIVDGRTRSSRYARDRSGAAPVEKAPFRDHAGVVDCARGAASMQSVHSPQSIPTPASARPRFGESVPSTTPSRGGA